MAITAPAFFPSPDSDADTQDLEPLAYLSMRAAEIRGWLADHPLAHPRDRAVRLKHLEALEQALTASGLGRWG